ncbi:Dephospho-CoA kinase [Candidatus Bealeia paramacronuclearis]|uniref:Dephospho-CoA kinase n=1 Tax=Candidatus Bealeia paramacronuclearis TaxID=1921001 RepID=A0ABZ2C1D8_9PROT|nr:Dephospho-CoA kinase [Candidatus Bealeia paramacronuclearis]
MRILGLTGGIGAGKTTASRLLAYLKIPVHCSDQAVHKMMAHTQTVIESIKSHWPEVIQGGAVNRRALGNIVFSNEEALEILERIIFPEVYVAQRRFLKKHARLRTPWVVLDVPLLLETGAQMRMDCVTSLIAPQNMRIRRILRRPGMREGMIQGVLKRQVDDQTRRRKSDFILHSGLNCGSLLPQINVMLSRLPQKGRPHWRPGWGLAWKK